MRTKSTINKIILTLLTGFLFFAFSFQLEAQVAEALQFKNEVITQKVGERLSLELTNLPKDAKYVKSDGKIYVQINWQIGKDCNSGQVFKSTLQISESTTTIYTDYILSKSDNGKQIKLNVSYINPKEGQIPAEYFILAQPNCTKLKIIGK